MRLTLKVLTYGTIDLIDSQQNLGLCLVYTRKFIWAGLAPRVIFRHRCNE